MVSVLCSNCSGAMVELLPWDRMPEIEKRRSEGTLVAGQDNKSSATLARSVEILYFGCFRNVQGVPEKTLVIVQRPITQVWKQLLGQLGAVFKSSGYQLSFEPKKSRII